MEGCAASGGSPTLNGHCGVLLNGILITASDTPEIRLLSNKASYRSRSARHPAHAENKRDSSTTAISPDDLPTPPAQDLHECTQFFASQISGFRGRLSKDLYAKEHVGDFAFAVSAVLANLCGHDCYPP